MKASALAIALAFVLAAPAAAQEQKAKRKRAAKPAQETVRQVDPNEASWRLVKGSLPIFLPSWSMPIYMQAHGNQAYEEEKKWQEQQMSKGAKKKKPR